MDVTELCVNCKKNISYTTCTRCWKTNAKKCPYFAPKTNAERIRSMSDEELAIFLCNFRSYHADEYICEGCKAEKYCHAGHEGTIDWLQQPTEVNE